MGLNISGLKCQQNELQRHSITTSVIYVFHLAYIVANTCFHEKTIDAIFMPVPTIKNYTVVT